MAHENNRDAWDQYARKQHPFARPARNDQFQDPLATLDTRGWYGGSLKNKRVLCLAAGGGKHSALFATAGAEVTVVDISADMLAIDRQIASERGLNIRTITASMDDLSSLPDSCFDIVEQPVSTCYVPEVLPVYREVARVLVHRGIYVSQHKQPGSLQGDSVPSAQGYELIEPYYRNHPLPTVTGTWYRESETTENLHRWEQLIGCLCQSGFIIEDFYEPRHADDQAEFGSFRHRATYLPPYVRIKARILKSRGTTSQTPELWTP